MIAIREEKMNTANQEKNNNLGKLLLAVVAITALALASVTLSQDAASMITPKNAKEKSQMYYIVETEKSFDEALADLTDAVKRHGFGILYVHDLGSALRSKGVSFEEQCKVFEVCNPIQAAKVLSTDMRLNIALPCRISVFTEGGKTRIGMIRPADMLSSLSQDQVLTEVAEEVEAKTIQMIDETK